MLRMPTMLLLSGLTLAPAFSAQAQVNPFRGSTGAGLTSADFRMQDAAARRLVSHGTPADGAAESWSNPKTGASGRVTVESTFHKKGMLCRKVSFAAKTAARQDARTTETDWCRTSHGWRIVSP